MLVATSNEKVRLCAITQLTFGGKPYRFFTMLHTRSCTRLPYWSAISLSVPAVAGYALKAVVVALECFHCGVIVINRND